MLEVSYLALLAAIISIFFSTLMDLLLRNWNHCNLCYSMHHKSAKLLARAQVVATIDMEIKEEMMRQIFFQLSIKYYFL